MINLLHKNKRHFLRLDAYHLLKYKLQGQESKKEGILSFVRNISAGGVLFHSEDRIEPGTVLELEISFPSVPDPVKIKAKVLRSKSMKVGGFDVAVQFLDLDEKVKNIMSKRIAVTFDKTKEGDMKILASICIIAAIIAGIIALSVKFNLIPVVLFNASTWLKIVNTSLFFSIALSLVKK